MDKEISSYFEDEEFIKNISKYEEMESSNLKNYFDSDQIMDIAQYYYYKGKYEKAIEALNYGLTFHENNPTILIMKAQFLMQEEQTEEAKEIIFSLPKEFEDIVILLEGELALVEEREKDANRFFKKYLKIKPGIESYKEIAYIYSSNAYPDIAIKWMKEAEKTYPTKDDKEIIEIMAGCYIEMQETEEAIKIYNRLIDKDPYSVNYWLGLAKAHIAAKDYNEAMEACEFVEVLEPDNKQRIIIMAQSYYNLENYPKAQKYYDLYSEINEEYELPYYYSGVCAFHQKKYQESINYFNKTLRLGEIHTIPVVKIYTYIATCYEELGEKEKAAEYMDKAIQENPHSPSPYISKGKILYEMHEKEKAKKIFDEALMLPSADLSLIIEIGYFLIAHEEYDCALHIFSISKEKNEIACTLMSAILYKILNETEKFHECINTIKSQCPQELLTYFETLSITDIEKDNSKELFFPS